MSRRRYRGGRRSGSAWRYTSGGSLKPALTRPPTVGCSRCRLIVVGAVTADVGPLLCDRCRREVLAPGRVVTIVEEVTLPGAIERLDVKVEVKT